MGNGISWSGPIPLIFSPDQAATQRAYQATPSLAKTELNKVLQRFLHMEHFTLVEAKNYLRKYRPAAGSSVFANIVTAPPQPKRPRLDNIPPSRSTETGVYFVETVS
jgi:hypothetical protein